MALRAADRRPLDPAQIRELDTRELQEELVRLEEASFRLTFRSATEAVDNPLQFRVMRRNVARIKTVLRERKQG